MYVSGTPEQEQFSPHHSEMSHLIAKVHTHPSLRDTPYIHEVSVCLTGRGGADVQWYPLYIYTQTSL